jgi:hypothetical protein
MVPSWMNEDNGIWINNKTIIVDVLSDFIQNWLEDNLNPDLFVQMDKTVGNLQTEEKFESETLQIFEKMINTRMENFESQLNKFQTVE